MKRSQDKQLLKFLTYLQKLEIIEAIGVARLLKVDLVVRKDDTDANGEEKPSIEEKEYDVILSEIIDAFIAAPKNKRKNILDIMKAAVRGG